MRVPTTGVSVSSRRPTLHPPFRQRRDRRSRTKSAGNPKQRPHLRNLARVQLTSVPRVAVRVQKQKKKEKKRKKKLSRYLAPKLRRFRNHPSGCTPSPELQRRNGVVQQHTPRKNIGKLYRELYIEPRCSTDTDSRRWSHYSNSRGRINAVNFAFGSADRTLIDVFHVDWCILVARFLVESMLAMRYLP